MGRCGSVLFGGQVFQGSCEGARVHATGINEFWSRHGVQFGLHKVVNVSDHL
jgi:hypothetical protein